MTRRKLYRGYVLATGILDVPSDRQVISLGTDYRAWFRLATIPFVYVVRWYSTVHRKTDFVAATVQSQGADLGRIVRQGTRYPLGHQAGSGMCLSSAQSLRQSLASRCHASDISSPYSVWHTRSPLGQRIRRGWCERNHKVGNKTGDEFRPQISAALRSKTSWSRDLSSVLSAPQRVTCRHEPDWKD